MERSVAVGKTTVTAFVKWEEVFSTNDRGRKEVRYYLKRRDGTSDLAVVGKEKKLGRDTKKSSSLYRYRCAIRDKSLFASLNLPFEFPSKLRSRREVVDWLSSLVTDVSASRPPKPMNKSLEAGYPLKLKLKNFKDSNLHKTSPHTTEFQWVGSYWTCKKKMKHYEAYTCSSIKISVHDFVYVLAEKRKRLVAYLDDLYEDSQGNKMAVVRWFHKVDEVDLDLPRSSYNDKEIFFSLCLQDLSIECIDGVATVLSPQHYKNFLKEDLHAKVEPFVCRNEFHNKVVKPFDITQVKGYWNQNVHKLMSLTTSNVFPKSCDEIRPKKRLRRLVDAGDSSGDDELNAKKRNLVEIGSEIEVLSQDSGIRGMWLKAVVIKKHKDKIKIKYHDIKDAGDDSVNLEEWILASRVAATDQLGIRHSGRMTIRPSRSLKIKEVSLVEVGCIVDAWLDDGWWEGIVVHKESDDKIHVYFPGEKRRFILGSKKLRYSEEWVGNEWKQMKSRPDVIALISSAKKTNSQTTNKSQDNLSSLENGVAGREQSEHEVVGDDSRKYILAHLKWNWSKKKRQGKNANDLKNSKTTKRADGFLVPSSVKQDHEKCKSHFCRSVASPLTSLVMSR